MPGCQSNYPLRAKPEENPHPGKGGACPRITAAEPRRVANLDLLSLATTRQTGKFALLLPGANANPNDIRFTDTLSKTRAGKIISRLLRELAAGGKVSGEATTLEDFSVLKKLREEDE